MLQLHIRLNVIFVVVFRGKFFAEANATEVQTRVGQAVQEGVSDLRVMLQLHFELVPDSNFPARSGWC